MAHILIVDDEPSIVNIISVALETDGFSQKSATTSADALLELESRLFDLVILDIGLPDINGFELAKIIRQSSQIPIIFLTARNSEIDRVVGLELGADDYVTKPFSPRELSARVKAVLRRSEKTNFAASSQPIQNNAVFVVNENKMQISYHQTQLELSRTEYRLLSFLIKQPDRVFNRDQLMNQAWEHSAISLDRTVDTHIKTLRQKLKIIYSQHDPIVTHRGIGYSLQLEP